MLILFVLLFVLFVCSLSLFGCCGWFVVTFWWFWLSWFVCCLLMLFDFVDDNCLLVVCDLICCCDLVGFWLYWILTGLVFACLLFALRFVGCWFGYLCLFVYVEVVSWLYALCLLCDLRCVTSLMLSVCLNCYWFVLCGYFVCLVYFLGCWLLVGWVGLFWLVVFGYLGRVFC